MIWDWPGHCQAFSTESPASVCGLGVFPPETNISKPIRCTAYVYGGSDLICDANRKFEAFTHCWHSSLLASASDLPFFFLPAAPTKLSISASNWSTCNSLLSPHIKPNEVQPECWECQCTGWASPSCRSAPARQGPSGRKRWGPARQEIFRKLV